MHKPGEILLGKYEVISLLGAGSYGTVYLVRDLDPALLCFYPLNAIKQLDLLSIPDSNQLEALALFEREAAILKCLKFPGVAAFSDYFRCGDSHYIVMEYVRGKTLEEMMKLQGCPFSPREVIPWALQIADILQDLHGHRPYPVIFRDLKPSNIMLTGSGKIKLIDFGIARYFKPGKTKDTYFLGTPGFSAPEQYGFGQSDPRSDIFSFGATLYYLLTWEDPGQPGLRTTSLRKITRFAVPAWLEKIIMKCLSANPGERFQSASSLKAELEREVNNSRSKTQGANSSKHLPRLMEILISISIISILAAILVPNFLRARSQGCLQSCPSNLKNLGTAIEMYSTDSRGKYPKSLDQVTPNYLKVIPTCASAGTWTYTYSTSEDQRVYTIYCRGSYHTTISKANYPQYDSIRGLIEE